MKKTSKYLITHPWLTFHIDAKQLNWRCWVLLGEAVSKLSHVARSPMLPDKAERLHRVYLAKGVAATTRIEGNTLTAEQVEKIMAKEFIPPPSKEYQKQEVENMLELYNDKSLTERNITPALIREINERVLKDLEVGTEVVPGMIRKHEVGAGTYRGAPFEDCNYLIERLCTDIINKPLTNSADPTDQLIFGILRALVTHLYIVWIHPFGDGNGRTGRILEYLVLYASGCPKPSTLVTTTFYSETRDAYFLNLSKSSQANDWTVFVCYALQGFVDGLREQIDVLMSQLVNFAWKDMTRSVIGSSAASDAIKARLEDLMGFVSAAEAPVELSGMKEQLPGKVGLYYVTKSLKTLERDVERLHQMNLVKIEKGRLMPNKNSVFAFLPNKKN